MLNKPSHAAKIRSINDQQMIDKTTETLLTEITGKSEH